MAGPLGASPGIVLGVGIGTAAAAAIEPAVELPRQKAWSQNAVRVLDPAVMTRLVAQGGVSLVTAHAEGLLEGYGTDKIDALVYLAQTVPGFAQAMTLWRRHNDKGAAFDDLWTHSLVKQGLDARYLPYLNELRDEWLTPAQVALAIVRSVMTDPGILVKDLNTADSNVPQYTAPTLDTLTEALGGGIDKDRLKVLVASIGLPPAVQQLASMYFRGIITHGGYNQGIQQGDARPEWAPFWLEQARQILTAGEYAELELRGYYNRKTRLANTAQHGMSEADSDLLFDVMGRGLALHQMVIGKARGGVYGNNNPAIPADELASMQRGNLRPEYYDIAWHGRYSYPTGFQIKAEATAGNLTTAETDQILLELGWDPKWASHFSAAWTGGKAAGGTVKKDTVTLLTQEYLAGVLSQAALTAALTGMGYSAQQTADMILNINFKAASAERTRATRALEKRFVGAAITETEARAQLALIGWPQGVIDSKIAAWYAERAEVLTTLNVAQVVKAFKKSTIDQPTALGLLEDLGHSPADAQILLTDA